MVALIKLSETGKTTNYSQFQKCLSLTSHAYNLLKKNMEYFDKLFERLKTPTSHNMHINIQKKISQELQLTMR